MGFFLHMMELNKILEQEITINDDLILDLIQLIDLTTFSSTDHNDSVLELVHKANQGIKGKFVAAVCVYANFGDLVRKNLDPSINTAVVGGNFPCGQTLLKSKSAEVFHISQSTVDEIDIVINRGLANSEDYEAISKEVSELKKASNSKHLKVILETGELRDQTIVRNASLKSIESGADFIKTSTGKMVSGADAESVYTMCVVIKEHFTKTNKKIGIKPSGGIRTLEDALVYYKIVKHVLGEEWLNSKLFRIGASSLYDNLISELSE